MSKKNVTSNSRRKFFKKAAAVTGATAAAVAACLTLVLGQGSHGKTVKLKMQAAWGGGIFLEMAKQYGDRVNAMGGGSLQLKFCLLVQF